MVRTSSSRTKAVFDDLAARIEKAWYDAVEAPTDSADKASKKMHFITFYPMIAARENGVTIPDVRSPFQLVHPLILGALDPSA